MPSERHHLHEEIAAWAAEHAGTSLDLDKDLEQAGIMTLDRPVEAESPPQPSPRPICSDFAE
jgi:hypothetical protein